MPHQPGKTQSIVELLLVVSGLGIVIWLHPLGSEGFEAVTGFLCLGVLFYVAFSAVLVRGSLERWGFPFTQKFDSAGTLGNLAEDVSGCVLLGGFFIAGAMPILFLRMLAPQPIFVSQAWSYFLWCAVQDFLFFSLILRNLEDHIAVEIAVPVTAFLFGFSHYPFPLLMAVTSLAGGLWSYAFLKTRSLALVTCSHWLMGIALLS